MGADRLNPRQFGIGAFLLIIAVLLAAGAVQMPKDKGYSILGPHVFPLVVAAFVGTVALLLCWQAATGGFRNASEERGPAPDLPRKLGAMWVSVGILAVALLITRVGFVLSAALLFALAARGFGSRRPVGDVAIGIALTLPVYWLFTRGLGLSLPPLINAWI
jgi:putative tricarboxylic transport membrane protein